MTAISLFQRRNTGTVLIAVGALLLTMSAVMVVGVAPMAGADDHCEEVGDAPTLGNGGSHTFEVDFTFDSENWEVDVTVSRSGASSNYSLSWVVNEPSGGEVSGTFNQGSGKTFGPGTSGSTSSAAGVITDIVVCPESAEAGGPDFSAPNPYPEGGVDYCHWAGDGWGMNNFPNSASYEGAAPGHWGHGDIIPGLPMPDLGPPPESNVEGAIATAEDVEDNCGVQPDPDLQSVCVFDEGEWSGPTEVDMNTFEGTWALPGADVTGGTLDADCVFTQVLGPGDLESVCVFEEGDWSGPTDVDTTTFEGTWALPGADVTGGTLDDDCVFTANQVAGPGDTLPDTGPGHLLALLAGGLGLVFLGSGSLVIANGRRRVL